MYVHIRVHFCQVELLGQKVWVCTVLVGGTKQFSNWQVPIYIPTSNTGVPIASYPPHIVLPGISILVIPVDLK